MPTDAHPTANLVDALEVIFRRYLVLAPGLALVLALWAIATHLFDAFDAFPYLAITSPTKRCGKTRTSELLSLVCAKARNTVGISVAALYRIIEAEKPTLVIDEAESLRGTGERAAALREILNAGYRKGQKVIRCGPQDSNFKPQKFETFCPKVLVLIRNLPDTLADRCLPIRMSRRTGETLERFRFGRARREAAPLRRQAKYWAERNKKTASRYYEGGDVPFLEDREAELWLPLFIVCDLIAPRRRAELEAVAKSLAELKSSDEPGDLGIRLLGDVRQVFEQHRADRLATATIVYDLNLMLESPWPGWSRGRGLDARGISLMLRPYEIHPQNIRFDSGSVAKGYFQDAIIEACKRYLPPSIRYAATEGINIGGNEGSPSASEPVCSGTQNTASPNVDAGCSGVADE